MIQITKVRMASNPVFTEISSHHWRSFFYEHSSKSDIRATKSDVGMTKSDIEILMSGMA